MGINLSYTYLEFLKVLINSQSIHVLFYLIV